MRIVINHLTRMHGGHICVAGVDVETGRHVRPVPADGNMPCYQLARYGGPLEMARIIELGSVRPRPEPPHVEDYVYVSAWAKAQRTASAREFWDLLEGLCRPRLRAIFGSDLHALGRGRYGTDAGCGLASLGCLRPAVQPELHLGTSREGKPQLRMRLSDGEIEADAGVTDLRLHGSDHTTPDAALVQAVARRIAAAEDVIIGLGLTRRFQPTAQSKAAHYLQVNNIHFREEPLWPLG